MKPKIKFKPNDLDKELIVEMSKRFSLYEISVKFDIKYSDLVNRCIFLKIKKELLNPENDRFAKADKICKGKGYDSALHYIRENGVNDFRVKIKPLIC